LRKHYTDLQILEMLMSIAGNNSINRWKEGAGIPQSKESSNFLRNSDKPLPSDRPLPVKTYLTPTPEQFRNRISLVAPLQRDATTGECNRECVFRREPIEPRAEVEKRLKECRERALRLPLVDEVTARKPLPDDWSKEPLAQWVRLLANFPRDGKNRILALSASREKGDLTPLLKAEVSWVIARQDRAYYALGQAMKRLQALGWSDDQIFQLDGDLKDFSPRERALFTLARKLAAAPIVLTDADVAKAVAAANPRGVVQLIQYTCDQAYFNRVTEIAGLRLEP
jgi:alkylhydroperoxidase family enzyme